jgi:hypothetical protein
VVLADASSQLLPWLSSEVATKETRVQNINSNEERKGGGGWLATDLATFRKPLEEAGYNKRSDRTQHGASYKRRHTGLRGFSLLLGRYGQPPLGFLPKYRPDSM